MIKSHRDCMTPSLILKAFYVKKTVIRRNKSIKFLINMQVMILLSNRKQPPVNEVYKLHFIFQ